MNRPIILAYGEISTHARKQDRRRTGPSNYSSLRWDLAWDGGRKLTADLNGEIVEMCGLQLPHISDPTLEQSTWPHATYVLYKRTVFKPVGFESILILAVWSVALGAKGSYSQLWSISSGAQYVTLQKYFSHPKFSFFGHFLVTPPMKRKLRGGVLLIRNHLDQSLWWANQKYWVPVSQIVFITLFFCKWTASLTAPFTSHCELCDCAEPKVFSWAKPAYFDFSSSNFNVQKNHILSIAGGASSISSCTSKRH